MRVLCIGILFGICSMAYAQDQDQDQETSTQEDVTFFWQSIARSLNLDVYYGFNLLQNPHSSLAVEPLGSSTWALSVRYRQVLADEKFNVYAGISLGEQWLLWKNEDLYLEKIDDQTQFAAVRDLSPSPEKINRNVFTSIQIGLPIFFQFCLTKKRTRGFHFGVGGYVQYAFSTRTKLKYEVGGLDEKRIIRHDYDIRSWQFGAEARVGWSAVFVSYRHGLQPYFAKGSLDDDLFIHAINIGLTSFY